MGEWHPDRQPHGPGAIPAQLDPAFLDAIIGDLLTNRSPESLKLFSEALAAGDATALAVRVRVLARDIAGESSVAELANWISGQKVGAETAPQPSQFASLSASQGAVGTLPVEQGAAGGIVAPLPPVPVQPGTEPGKPIWTLRSRPTPTHKRVRLSVIFTERVHVKDLVSDSADWRIESISVGPSTFRPGTDTGLPSERLKPSAKRPPFDLDVPAGSELAVKARYVGTFPEVGRLRVKLYGAPFVPDALPPQQTPVVSTGTLAELASTASAAPGAQVHLKAIMEGEGRIEALLSPNQGWTLEDVRLNGISAVHDRMLHQDLRVYRVERSPIVIVFRKGDLLELVLATRQGDAARLQVSVFGRRVTAK